MCVEEEEDVDIDVPFCVVNAGAILGLNMAVNSLVRTFSPTLGGYLLGLYGFSSFGYFGTVVSLVLVAVLFVRHQRKAL